MQRLIKSMPGFLALYLLFMVPTYVLPYFGSNSSIGTLIGGAVGGWGGMFPPQWWAHMFVLGVLVVIAWARGSVMLGKGYLPVLALLAAIFDMTPVLRAIPLVPTALHVLVIVQGIIKCTVKEDAPTASPMWRQPSGVLGMMAAVAVVGSAWSMLSMTQTMTATAKKADGRASAPRATQQLPVVNAPMPAPMDKPAAAGGPQPPAATASIVPIQPQVTTPDAPTPAPLPIANAPVAEKSPEKTARVQKAKAPGNSAAVADHLGEGRNCLAAKRFDCALSQAKAVLRLEPANAAAQSLLAKAQAGQQAAMDNIEIR